MGFHYFSLFKIYQVFATYARIITYYFSLSIRNVNISEDIYIYIYICFMSESPYRAYVPVSSLGCGTWITFPRKYPETAGSRWTLATTFWAWCAVLSMQVSYTGCGRVASHLFSNATPWKTTSPFCKFVVPDMWRGWYCPLFSAAVYSI